MQEILSIKEFLKKLWSKERVEVDADALRNTLKLVEVQEKRIKDLIEENKGLGARASYWEQMYNEIKNELKRPVFVDLRA